MKIVHIIWFLSFCIASFCIGFFFDGSYQKNSFINDKGDAEVELRVSDLGKAVAIVSEQGVSEQPIDVPGVPKDFINALPVVSAEAQKISTDAGTRLGNQDGFNVFIKNIQASFDPIKRQISGSYILENFDERGLDTVFIQSLLVLPGKEESFPPYYFEPQKGEKFSISGKTEMKKSFTHIVPDGISGNNAQIILELYLGSGDLMTFMESPKFDISGNSRFLSITHPRLINSLKEAYLVGEGPTIYSNQEPKNLTFTYKVVNENKAAITVSPALRVYKFSDSNPLILEDKLSPIVIDRGVSSTLSFPVPTMNYVPGIYLGKFLLLDVNGRNLIPDVSVRWIIGGDVARIINIVNYTSSPTEGKTVDVDVEYVGTPPDTQKRVDNLQNQKDVLMSVQIEDSTGMKVSEIVKKNIPIYIGQRSAKIPFSVTPSLLGSELFLRVTISDQKNILDEQRFSLTQSLRIQDQKNSPTVQTEETEGLDNQQFTNGKIFIVFLFTCFVFMVFHAFFLKNHGFFIFLFCFFGVGFWYNNADAYVENCELANISVTGPSPSETFWCGQTYTFTGGWWMNACANTDAAMVIDGNQVGYHEGLNCVRPGCEYNIRKYGTFAVARAMPSDFRGRHVVRIGWSKSQGDCSNSGTETYAVNVSCTIHGACGSIHGSSQLWPTSGTWCGVGTMSSWTQVGDVSNNNAWGWNCSGFDGGSTASCYFVQQCPIGFVLNYGSCRLARCDSNPGINMSNTVPVTLSELPSTLPYTFTKDYTNTLVMNGSNTAEKCEYTCANGYRADLALNPQKCIPIACSANIASNGLKCADDESNLSGNLDISRVRRANVGGCTGPQKCEWYCPADKPVYCATRNECVVNADDCGCPAGQKMCGNGQCILGNLTCPPATPAQCNNDGLCNNNESCDCSDCTNGDADDTDHCKNGLRCTKDEGQPMCTESACCPLGMNWSCDSNACTNACGTHVPSELKAGIDIPFITCDAKTGSTHFRYQITKVSSSNIAATSTSTNTNFKVQKLLAKAVAGVCPTDASAYVPNLTGVVTNDKICVRLIYNNATTGAISNALITDSLPTGFTRIDNSTKNCLTPTGSPELCSDAPGMGGAIGNNGWSGNNFSLTPHAGFYAIPTNKTTGDKMEMGKKNYLNYAVCDYNNIDPNGINRWRFDGAAASNTSNFFANLATYRTNTNKPTACSGPEPASFSDIELSLIGKKYLDHAICDYSNITPMNYNPWRFDGAAASNTSNFFANLATYRTNTNKPTACSGPEPASFSKFTTDIQNLRYIHLAICDYNNIFTQGAERWRFDGAAASNTSNFFANLATYRTNTNKPTACSGPEPASFSSILIDTLDTTNGKGYIQYMVEVTTTPSNLTLPSVILAGTTTTADTSSANATINTSATPITSGAVYTSDIYPSGTTVRHTGPLMDAGSYSVKCFYGTSTSSIDTMIPALCDKSISVKPMTDTVQGCSGIYGHRGNTPSDEMTHNTAFDASFSCGSRLDVSSQNFPYKLTVGTQSPVYLQSDPFNILGLGFVSLVSQKYTFSGATDVTCAIKVGDGYSTNNSCKIRTCVGTNCSVPQTFVITPSRNALCTNLPDATYDIGCNENSPQYAECVAWFYAGTSQKIRLNNNPPQNLTCTTSTPPGALSPVKTCTISLPSGGVPVTVFAGDKDSFQTTVYSLTRDQKVPAGKLEFYTNYSSGTKLETSQYQFWQKQAVTAVVTCTDDPGPSDGSGCACASTLQENGTEQFWSSGRPSGDPKIGPDIMTYSRVFLNNSASASSVRVRDTAGLLSSPIPVSIGVDTVPPKVTVTVPANNRFSIVAQDSSEGGSGLWKPGSLRPIPAGITKNPTAPGILYKTFTKAAYLANPSALEFDEKCGLPAADNGDYYSFGQLTSAVALAAQTIPSTTLNGIRSTYASTTSMVAYCVQDNAGNVTRGVYPSDPVGCFSASNMDVIPNLQDTKIAARLGNAALSNEKKYGYGLSEDLANASCFRSLISANISALITNQFVPEVTTDIAWDKSAYIKGITPLKRNMSYYYYSNTTANPPAMTATTLTPIRKITNSPTGTGVKTVLVDGENIQINANINYAGSDRVLVLIARKNAKGAGGNILINPSVTRIDAILIADGAILNAVNGSLRNSATPAHASALTNRLIINGRLYSFNTRGGSLIASGSLIGPATGTLGKYFQNNVLMATTPTTINKSSEQDLERFRMIFADGNPLCSLHINYDITNTANLPPVLERPANFTGGTCSF